MKKSEVLILILMEDTLRDDEEIKFNAVHTVLILILMEDTLRDNVSPFKTSEL